MGVDWGGTKIEAVALSEDGRQLARVREDTPRSDYPGCLALIASLVDRVGPVAGGTGSVGVGIPGPLDPDRYHQGRQLDLPERSVRRG